MTEANARLAMRVRAIRREIYGLDGVATLARDVDVPARTWENFERGVTIPAPVLLRFLEATGAEPTWLMTGEGERYRRAGQDLRIPRAGSAR